MSLLQAILLGIVQGLTEWIPVSSSAHLVIFQEYFKIKASILFDVLVQVASLFALLFIFRQDIKNIIKSFFNKEDKSYRKLGFLIIFATIFTVIIALLFRKQFESFFSNLTVVGISLIITGIILFLTKFAKEKYQEISYRQASLIGITQGIAIIPGISRSGSTISIGMLLGINREQAARFSFLLFIPAIIGALILQLTNFNPVKESISFLAIGFISSLIVSFLTLKWLLRIIKTRKFHYFSIYCIILGVLILII
ncbi:MAG TPA: undecaprenyl-diphosphatase UppP [Candidatus Nanoarchaeia archaeon]|nr:undecaprenyl-diphosphatase UppP [Candidatus Nanoarchaeia archaeon]